MESENESITEPTHTTPIIENHYYGGGCQHCCPHCCPCQCHKQYYQWYPNYPNHPVYPFWPFWPIIPWTSPGPTWIVTDVTVAPIASGTYLGWVNV